VPCEHSEILALGKPFRRDAETNLLRCGRFTPARKFKRNTTEKEIPNETQFWARNPGNLNPVFSLSRQLRPQNAGKSR
jgi:hypothetical protein